MLMLSQVVVLVINVIYILPSLQAVRLRMPQFGLKLKLKHRISKLRSGVSRLDVKGLFRRRQQNGYDYMTIDPASIQLVDDMETLEQMQADLFQLAEADDDEDHDHDDEFKMVCGIDAEWKPENYYVPRKWWRRLLGRRGSRSRSTSRNREEAGVRRWLRSMYSRIRGRGAARDAGSEKEEGVEDGREEKESIPQKALGSRSRSGSDNSERRRRRPKRAPGQSSPVALLQISCSSGSGSGSGSGSSRERGCVWVLDLLTLLSAEGGDNYNPHPGDDNNPQQQLPPSPLSAQEAMLDAVFELLFHSEAILKVGLGPQADLKRLAWSYVFCYTIVLPSFLVWGDVSVCLSLIHLLLPSCII
jgi:hypothetical protein